MHRQQIQIPHIAQLVKQVAAHHSCCFNSMSRATASKQHQLQQLSNINTPHTPDTGDEAKALILCQTSGDRSPNETNTPTLPRSADTHLAMKSAQRSTYNTYSTPLFPKLLALTANSGSNSMQTLLHIKGLETHQFTVYYNVYCSYTTPRLLQAVIYPPASVGCAGSIVTSAMMGTPLTTSFKLSILHACTCCSSLV